MGYIWQWLLICLIHSLQVSVNYQWLWCVGHIFFSWHFKINLDPLRKITQVLSISNYFMVDYMPYFEKTCITEDTILSCVGTFVFKSCLYMHKLYLKRTVKKPAVQSYISAYGKLRQEDHKTEASMGYIQWDPISKGKTREWLLCLNEKNY